MPPELPDDPELPLGPGGLGIEDGMLEPPPEAPPLEPALPPLEPLDPPWLPPLGMLELEPELPPDDPEEPPDDPDEPPEGLGIDGGGMLLEEEDCC